MFCPGFDVQRVLADDSMLKQAGSAAPSKPVLQVRKKSN